MNTRRFCLSICCRFVVGLFWICCAISCKTNPQQIEQYHDLNIWQINMATGRLLLLLLIASSQSVYCQPTTDDQVCDGQHLNEIKRDIQMLLDNQKQPCHHLGKSYSKVSCKWFSRNTAARCTQPYSGILVKPVVIVPSSSSQLC